MKDPRTAFRLAAGAMVAGAWTALILAWTAPGPAYAPRVHASAYSLNWAVIAFIPAYAVALWAAGRAGGPSLHEVLLVSAVVALPLVCAPLLQSQDLVQYLFYARMQVVHGANPYVTSPAVFAQDPWLPWLAWPRQVSVYGPAWSLAMAGVVAAAGASIVRATALAKVVATALGAVGVWGITRVPPASTDHRPGDPDPRRRTAVAVAGFALNPLVLSTVALAGHADAAVAAAWIWAINEDRRGRRTLATALLASATLVKSYAGVALVAYLVAAWRRDGARVALRGASVAVALAAVTFAPYWAGARTFSGTLTVAEHASASLAGELTRIAGWASARAGVPLRSAEMLTVVRIVGAVVVVAVLWAGARRGSREAPWPYVTAAVAAYLLVTPWFLPWHALGLVALACVVPESPLSTPALVFSGSALVTAGATVPLGATATALVRYLPPIWAYRRGRRSAAAMTRTPATAPRTPGSPPRPSG